MRRARFLLAAMVLGGVLIVTAGLPVRAQEATPGAIDLSPNPELCNQAPRTLAELQAVAGTPAPAGSGEATAAALDQSQQPVELPVGEEPPKEAIDGIVATIVQNIACHNGGDVLSVLGGVTDTYLQSQIAAGYLDEDLMAAIAASPTAMPEEQQLQLLDTREFALYPDGRVGVLVYYRTPAEPESGVDGLQIELWIFQQTEGRWLLDEVIGNLEQQLQDVATPAAG